ncbi:Yip1 family protein [Lysobacter sp. A378]
MDIGKIVERAKSILLSPKREWPVIADEPASVKSLYTGYIMILAAIPAVFGFIKGSLIGHSVFGVSVTTSIMAGLFGMVVSYILGLVMLYVIALIINALAPTFGGQKNQLQALKVVAYAWTAAWIAGIATIIPWLGWLIALAGGIYSIYLLYLGLPHTMKCPPEKAAGYTAVSVVITVVLTLLLGVVVAGFTGMAGLTGAAVGGGAYGGDKDNVTFDEDSQLGRLAAMGQRMQAAAEAQAEAGNSGSTSSGSDARSSSNGSDADANAQAAQAEQVMGAMMGAMLGGKDGKVAASLAPDQLKAFLPESIGNLTRESLSSSRNGAMGMQITEAKAGYANADRSQRVDLQLTDAPATGGLMAMANAFGGGGESESQSADGYEKTYTLDGQRIHEQWNNKSQRGEYSISVGGRFQVEAKGQVDSMDQLKGIVGSLDLKRLAAMKGADEQKQ